MIGSCEFELGSSVAQEKLAICNFRTCTFYTLCGLVRTQSASKLLCLLGCCVVCATFRRKACRIDVRSQTVILVGYCAVCLFAWLVLYAVVGRHESYHVIMYTCTLTLRASLHLSYMKGNRLTLSCSCWTTFTLSHDKLLYKFTGRFCRNKLISTT